MKRRDGRAAPTGDGAEMIRIKKKEGCNARSKTNRSSAAARLGKQAWSLIVPRCVRGKIDDEDMRRRRK